MAGIHKRFDLERWIAEFPLARKRAEVRVWVAERERENPGTYANAEAMEEHARLMDPDGEIIVGPESIAYAEQLRREAGEIGRLGPGVPVDVMVWGKGEPEHPAATKVAGVPYRPAGLPWPVGKEGGPCEFIGQICFAESREILRDTKGRPVELPGDVLVLFVPGSDGLWDSDEDDSGSLIYEWYPLGLTDLMTAADVPQAEYPLEPCYAELHRTVDYPSAPDDHPLLQVRRGERLCVLEGGKIGGAPKWSQEPEPRPGAFVAALGSIDVYGERYPLVNVPENTGSQLGQDRAFLMLGDVGSLYLFVSQGGMLRKKPRLHWVVQSY